MKKVLLSLAVLFSVLTVNAAVSYTGKAKIKLTSAAGYYNSLIVAQSDALAEGWNNGYCAEINMSGANVAVYAIYDTKNYATFGTKELGEMPIGIKTDASASYTFEVSGVVGSLKLYDAVADSVIVLTNGATYNFTAAPNSTITDRFRLGDKPAPLVYEICFRYGKLQVSAYKDGVVVVKNAAGAEVVNQTMASNYEEIDLSALAAGQYTVEANGQVLTIQK